MGWTKEHREHLQQAADNGDQAAAAELERMRARNLENKRSSDARLRAQRANRSMVTKAVVQRLHAPKDDSSAKSSPPPPLSSTAPPRDSFECRDLVGSCVVSRPREVLGQGMDTRHLGAFDGFEGVRWKPLSEIRDQREAKVELEKVSVLEGAIKERKKALKTMVKGKGRLE